MVSILIPVYGEVIDTQLATLANEIKLLDFKVEIIVCDDASPHPKKPFFQASDHGDFRFIQLDKNLGRSAIRNYLGQQAKYAQLIFMDADCLPISSEFIQNYVKNFDPEQILVGGQLFSEKPPKDPNKLLRWKYGTEVEARSIKKRREAPYKSFMANNFSISKSLLSRYCFDNQHSGYGHEDTLFGLQLKKQQVPVNHIDNPIRHVGLETNAEFVEKTIEGVKNLAWLYTQEKIDSHVKLIQVYQRLKASGLGNLSAKYLSKKIKKYQYNLVSKKPSLRIFSLFKLAVFMRFMEELSAEGQK